MKGFGIRLAHLRAAHSISLKELAAAAGLEYTDLLRLESGPRREPPPELLRRLAEFFHTTEEYVLLGMEPSPQGLRSAFFRHYDAMRPDDRQALKFAPIQGRIEAVLHFLERSFPTVLDRRQVASRVGYTPQALDDVVRGAAPLQSYLLKHLSSMVGLSMDFFVRGDFFGGAVPDHQLMNPEQLSQYYQVVQDAISAGISPAALSRAVRILAVRDSSW